MRSFSKTFPGGIVDETPASTVTVPSAETTDVATMTLPAGVWVVTASCRFNSNMTGQIIRGYLTNGNASITFASVLGPGDNGGGLSLSAIVNATSSTVVKLRMFQGSGSDKGAQVFSYRAVRIA